MNILIAAGGTGGHLYPGIALAEEFRKEDKGAKILFVGTKRGLESNVLSKKGFDLRVIDVKGLVGRGMIKGLLGLFILPISLIEAVKIISDFRPEIVIGIGGYASGPVILAAFMMGKKRVILEPNLIPGITNRILNPLVNLVVTSFEDSEEFFIRKNTELLGNPVRNEISGLRGVVKGSSERRTIFVFGGSQGAQSINLAMIEALDHLIDLKDRIQIIHQTGVKDLENIKEGYRGKGFVARIEPYIYDMAEVYQESDLIISRSGATTIAEITAMGKPAILIPYPFATHQHQKKNAEAIKRAGGAEMILSHELSGKVLADKIRSLMENEDILKEMGKRSRSLGRPGATANIVKRCREMVLQEQ